MHARQEHLAGLDLPTEGNPPWPSNRSSPSSSRGAPSGDSDPFTDSRVSGFLLDCSRFEAHFSTALSQQGLGNSDGVMVRGV